MVALTEYFWDVQTSTGGGWLMDRGVLEEMKEEKCYSILEAYTCLLQVWKEFHLYRYVGQYVLTGVLWKKNGNQITFRDVIYFNTRVENYASELGCCMECMRKVRTLQNRFVMAELDWLCEQAENEGRPNIFIDQSTQWFVRELLNNLYSMYNQRAI